MHFNISARTRQMDPARGNSGADAKTARVFLRLYSRIIWKETRRRRRGFRHSILYPRVHRAIRIQSVLRIHKSVNRG